VRIAAFRLARMPQPVSPSSPASVRDPRTGSQNFPKPNVAYAPRQIQLGIELFFRRSAEGSVHKELPSRLQNTEPVVCRNCELVIRCGQHPGFYCLFTNSLKTNCLSGLVHLHSRTSIAKIIITSPLTCFRNLVITNGVLPDEFGGVPLLAEVRLQEGESLENALRRFKRKVQQEDIIKEVKRHSFYLKPGEKKRVKAALARKRARKKTRKEQD